MNLCASVSLCEIWIHYVPSTTTNVTTYPLLSCGTNITRYVWGFDLSGTPQGAGGVGGLVAVISPLLKGGGGGADGGLFYPCYDANGNITEYVDTNGVVVAHYEYDAFGNTVNKSGTMADDFVFRFSTKYFDTETGLCYYGRIRYYKPSFGRFISRDPIEEQGGLNLYGFCGNDPINKWDYLGMTTVWDDEDFPGAKRGRIHLKGVDTCKYIRVMRDGWDGDVQLQRLTREDIDYQMEKMIARLDQFYLQDGYRSRKYEREFDSRYVLGPKGVGSHYYYFVKEVDKTKIYVSHEINYIGIGLYEAWVGGLPSTARVLTFLWKLKQLKWPTSGAFFWLNYGYNSYWRFRPWDMEPIWL